jgi:hypothetical protein
MFFSDLKPGDLFTFDPVGDLWQDLNLYRKATERTYHRADKVLKMHTLADLSSRVTPEAADAVQTAL